MNREENAALDHDAKGDGETWEEYAHRLERRIKQQRDQLRALGDLRNGPQRTHRRRIAHLEMLLGQREAKLAHQHAGLKALNARLSEWDRGTVDGAIDILAQILWESGQEIGELVEKRRAELLNGGSANG